MVLQNNMEGQTALVTGCGRGIGKAIAKQLAQRGADLVINDVDPSALEALSQEMKGLGKNVLAHCASIADIKAVKDLFGQIKQKSNRLDILVNNAGITRDSLLLKMTDQEWDQVVDVNLKGAFYCTREAAGLMKEQMYGRIVNLSSETALQGNVGQVNYTASKAGLIGMTKTLAKELARYQITVNAVAPGYIETAMTRKIPEKVKQAMISRIPLGRAGVPDDIAGLVGFLSSEASGYITGQVISCHGGLSL